MDVYLFWHQIQTVNLALTISGMWVGLNVSVSQNFKMTDSPAEFLNCRPGMDTIKTY